MHLMLSGLELRVVKFKLRERRADVMLPPQWGVIIDGLLTLVGPLRITLRLQHLVEMIDELWTFKESHNAA